MKPSFWGEGNLAREDGFVVEGGIIGALRRLYEGIGDHRILWEVLGLIDWNGSVLLGAHFFCAGRWGCSLPLLYWQCLRINGCRCR